MNEYDAAIIIQKAWRRHIDIQVFKYYRDLISFTTQGSPAMMLRCINPNEAKYLDEAAGIRVRFRLMGEKFPPNICYKIYTHRPVQDMCSNSPKNYTHPNNKQLQSKYVNNRQNINPGYLKSDEGWYKRYENNGWRHVSNRRLLSSKLGSQILQRPKTKDFHHNRLQRRQDVELKKKRRKIEWMKQMYKKGMLKAQDKDLDELINQAADGLVNTCKVNGDDHVQDWEVDELLRWTNGLNFDDYHKSWHETGTSASSDQYCMMSVIHRGNGDDRSTTNLTSNGMISVFSKGEGDIGTRISSGYTSTDPPNPSPRSEMV